MPTSKARLVIGVVGIGVLLAGALAYQSYRVIEVQRQLALLSKPRRAALAIVPATLDGAAAPFTKSVRKTIPDIFWGEFAEDVHDCGTAQSFVVTDKKLMVKEDEQEDVEEVRWLKPKLISLSTRGGDWLERAYAMELSPDSNEITFIFTNMKVIRQRCSARAHEEPPDVSDAGLNASDIDMNASAADY